MNDIIKTLQERVSLRRYKDLPIKEEDLDTIIKSTMKAPTAGNMQLYSIIVIKDEETKKKLSVTCDNQHFIAKAPEEADLFLACCDALIAAQNAVIATESLGIGSCYIGDIMENYEIHSEMFNLPKWAFPIVV